MTGRRTYDTRCPLLVNKGPKKAHASFSFIVKVSSSLFSMFPKKQNRNRPDHLYLVFLVSNAIRWLLIQSKNSVLTLCFLFSKLTGSRVIQCCRRAGLLGNVSENFWKQDTSWKVSTYLISSEWCVTEEVKSMTSSPSREWQATLALMRQSAMFRDH